MLRALLCEEGNCLHRHPSNVQEWRQKNHAIYHKSEYSFLETKKVEPVEPLIKNIYQSNTYRKDLSQPQCDNEPRLQEKQYVKDQQSCIFVFVAHLTISNQGHQPRHNNSIPYIGIWQIYRDTDQPQEKGTSQNELSLQFTWRQFQQQR